jgi:PPK2 family polyphosphate:nucleotide phosphotransferase
MSKKIFTKKERKQLASKIIDYCRVDPNENFKLSDYRKYWEEFEKEYDRDDATIKKSAKALLEKNISAMVEAQDLFYACGKYSLLLVFQAMDAAGKDGTIKHVMSGVNPQGCKVSSFKKPSSQESSHNWLWRYTKEMPAKGMIGIFNRSYYEEVLVLKVHPELLQNEVQADESIWEERYEDINNLEKHLTRSGTIILKFFLNVSKNEQKNRFIERLKNSDKNWKFSDNDLKERGHWDGYMEAFETAINATSSENAPWFVIPANNKWRMRAIISEIITTTIDSLDMEYPKTTAERKIKLEKSLDNLLNEKK